MVTYDSPPFPYEVCKDDRDSDWLIVPQSFPCLSGDMNPALPGPSGTRSPMYGTYPVCPLAGHVRSRTEDLQDATVVLYPMLFMDLWGEKYFYIEAVERLQLSDEC